MCPKSRSKAPGPVHGKAQRVAYSERDKIRVICDVAIDALTRVDGRASGIKFNKLLYFLNQKLSSATNRDLRFDLPYRWYCYGAAIDIHSPLVEGLVRVDHPEDEMWSNFTPVQSGQRPREEPAGLRAEVEPLALSWAQRFRGNEGFPSMLREHYVDAPEEFQRAYLEWSLLTRSVLSGHAADKPSEVYAAFREMVRHFPNSVPGFTS